MKQLHKVPVLSVLTAALLLVGVGATTSTPQTHGANAASSKGQARPKPFPVAELFFELNDSAGDLGIHSNIDGGPWTTLEVDDSRGRNLLTIVSQSRRVPRA